ncbi:necrosis inducing protein-domain-containing protein [Colletotrichum phormii]|uniref:Necrosis inducing protein-domain-containing protein n=1 Tax=Colletotrichum phormii TaxID=359342 RepID=A0AAJ0E7W9_9PEZI|nr:necrosis inducing protein-domain-containing protein [Colletotrichum phormii]KAK1622021.1 necrosis inducing protein-domain-containing protein [Colletotrichum phormii]
MRHSLFSSLLGLATIAAGAVLSPREKDVSLNNQWKNHNEIAAFQQQMADGTPGDIELRFKPWLNDGSGCFPYAAVYSRVGTSNGRPAVLYSWYLPKIQTKTENHRHWYLIIVVWLHTETCNAAAGDYDIAGISYSTGTETYDKSLTSSTMFASGDSGTGATNTHAIVGYDGQVNVFPSANNAQYGLSPPLISWDKLSPAATSQFNAFRYEHARCPFTDANIQASLDAAYNADFYANLPAEPDSNCGATPTIPSTPDASSTGVSSDPNTDPVEEGPEIPLSSFPADPTYTPTPAKRLISLKPPSQR